MEVAAGHEGPVVQTCPVEIGHLGLRVLRLTDAEWDGVPAAAAPGPVHA